MIVGAHFEAQRVAAHPIGGIDWNPSRADFLVGDGAQEGELASLRADLQIAVIVHA